MARRTARAEAVAEIMMNRLGANFRAVREQAGLTQVEVSAATGIRQTHISQIESGQRNLTIKIFARLALLASGESASLEEAADYAAILLSRD